ncbi:MAG: GTP-sensing pleiotropic transcriptional regulator CodY [Eubacterium sp.]|nr:GTP-sensing pleiotropic transcriptional regulator CodY [Eubacterium sp.]
MSVKLLDKTRKISRLLHENKSDVVIFSDICNLLGKLLGANVMVISQRGKVLGIYESPDITSLQEMLAEKIGGKIDSELNERFLSILSTKENGDLAMLGFENVSDMGYTSIIIPVDFAGSRMGTTFIYRKGKAFSVDDIILSEYANTVIELEMMRSVYEENEEEKRRSEILLSALDSLSVSEKRAVGCVLKSLGGNKEGIIVASRIAAENGITRSTIVNAMQKLESAGVLSVRSKGMKGTYVSVENDAVYKLEFDR